MLKSKLLSATAAAPEPVFIEDVFSTYLYTGNGAAQVIQNGINLGQSFGSGSAEFSNYLDTSPIALNTQITFTGDFTAEAFILVRDHHSSGTCWLGSTYPTNNNQLYITSAGYLAAYNESPTTNTVASSQQMSVGKFYHVAVTRSSGTIYLWVNGVSAGSGTHGGTFRFTTIGALGGYSGAAVDGFISNLRVSNNARYTSAFTPPTSALSVDGNTILLALQSDNLFTDKVGTYTLTKSSSVTASNFGPFDAAEAGEGGLVWVKTRAVSDNHALIDTERGGTFELNSNTTSGQGGGLAFTFNSDGFSIGNSTRNANTAPYASWTFRKAPRFFDCVSWSGNSTSGRAIPHNLGTTPGMIIVKWYDGSQNWAVWHKDLTAGTFLLLNGTNSVVTNSNVFTTTSPTDSVFYVGTDYATNGTSATYVAYLFAHDPLGPSGDGSDGLIACGSYTGNGSSNGPEITLGWEPQWVLIKRATVSTAPWILVDTMRGMPVGVADAILYPNYSNAEDGADTFIAPTPTGFKIEGNLYYVNVSGSDYIYIAIRRGPMRQPTSGTEVFEPSIYTGNNSYPRTVGSLPVIDLAMPRGRDGAGSPQTIDRMRGGSVYLFTSNTNAESNISPSYEVNFDNQNGLKIASQINSSGTNYVNYSFRRAPNFFDVVAYTGNGVAGRTVPHNLGVAPELMIVKSRSITNPWVVYHKDIGASHAIELNSTAGFYSSPAAWNSTAPTETVLSLGGIGGGTNASGSPFIAYLFASLSGISKVGSYTGNGSSQTINCGFTGGARFVLIKRTDSTGDWYVWDTARGIVSGNDPHLSLNTTAAEVTSDDTIDPDSSGFIVNQVTATNVNVSSASYIYLAIA